MKVAISAALAALLSSSAIAQDQGSANATSSVTIKASGKPHFAGVDNTGRLQVQTAAPSEMFHTKAVEVAASSNCVQLAAPPKGEAIVIQDVRIDVYNDPSPGQGQYAGLSDGNCENDIDQVNAGSVGQTNIPFGPGYVTRSTMFVHASGAITFNAYLDGYLIPAKDVPLTNVVQTTSGHAKQLNLPRTAGH